MPAGQNRAMVAVAGVAPAKGNNVIRIRVMIRSVFFKVFASFIR